MFALRIDIDSKKGLVEGVPRILELLRDKGKKASFYIPIGGESNIFELIRYRGGGYGSGIKKHSYLEKLRMALLPINFAKRHRKILQAIVEEGHELGAHGWRHRAWTRALDSIDLDLHFQRMVNGYKELFGRPPTTFAAPGFRTNEGYLHMLDKYGFTAASDLDGAKPFRPSVGDRTFQHVQVPITIRDGVNPIIESLVIKNKSDSQILKEVKKRIQNLELATMYCHAEYECIEKIALLREIIDFVIEQDIEMKTIEGIARELQV